MLAVEVAALRALPKEVVQLVELGFFLPKIVMEGLKHHSSDSLFMKTVTPKDGHNVVSFE